MLPIVEKLDTLMGLKSQDMRGNGSLLSRRALFVWSRSLEEEFNALLEAFPIFYISNLDSTKHSGVSKLSILISGKQLLSGMTGYTSDTV